MSEDPAVPIVLVQNERTEGGRYDHWRDATGEGYQYPNKYKNLIVTGRPFVYYQGKRRKDGRDKTPEYFGHGIIGETFPDPATALEPRKSKKRWYCEIAEYWPFERSVPFKDGDRYLEDVPRNQWGYARELPLATYREILRRAGIGPVDVARFSSPIPPEAPSLRTITPRPVEGGSLLVTSHPQTPGSGRHGSRRRSAYSKAIGDRGEEIVLEYLRDQLPRAQADSLRWVAAEGQKPGWDIEYKVSGAVIGVEVKATQSASFSSIEVTANEWDAACRLGDRYRIALVAEVWAASPGIAFIDDPAGLAEEGTLAVSPLSWRIQRLAGGDESPES